MQRRRRSACARAKHFPTSLSHTRTDTDTHTHSHTYTAGNMTCSVLITTLISCFFLSFFERQATSSSRRHRVPVIPDRGEGKQMNMTERTGIQIFH